MNTSYKIYGYVIVLLSFLIAMVNQKFITSYTVYTI